MPSRSKLWILAAGATLFAGFAQAGSVTLVDQSYTVGAPGAVSVNTLQISAPTTLDVTLSSIPWPQALASVNFELTTGTGQVIGTMSGFGTDVIVLPSAGTFYALAFAVPQPATASALGFGSYGLKIDAATVAAVSLPSTLALLCGALLLIGMLARRPRALTPALR